jgi:hypothetical protein
LGRDAVPSCPKHKAKAPDGGALHDASRGLNAAGLFDNSGFGRPSFAISTGVHVKQSFFKR